MRPMLLLSLLLGACAPVPPPLPPPESARRPREAAPTGPLPKDVRPVTYSLALTIDPAQPGFSGEAAIELELQRPRSLFWLHGQGLEVTRVAVEPGGGAPALPGYYDQMNDEGLAALVIPREVGPGRVRLLLAWRARYSSGLDGLYKVLTGDAPSAFTQFEAVSARKAFPGFDEPAFKTPFEVSIRAPKGATVIANTRALGQHEDGEWRVHRFAPTPPLPTYLLAWAVGALEVVEATPVPPNAVRHEPLPLRGVAVQGRGGRLRWALEQVAPVLASLEAYFGSPYPFDKLDLVAVPDFDASAMENPGAITFREPLLLQDPAQAPRAQQRQYLAVLAHELAHQWFGNLVTMRWWDELWLNESFASWMGARTMAALRPDLEFPVSLQESFEGAMALDSLASARRLRQPIASSHDIRNAFDRLTYSKGAGVLAMFERWLGPEAFRAGMRLYMQRHAFGNATSADLFAALSEAAGRDARGAFHSFTAQPGVPLLDVEVRCAEGGTALDVTQSRYLPLGSRASREGQWIVPFCVRYAVSGEAREQCLLLEKERESFLL
ncbi:MAG: M1 family metallopeptidase, partial [Myxococcales bacterium]